MPELPEVETLRIALSPLKGAVVKEIFTSRYNSHKDFSSLLQATIDKISRRGKFLIFNFSNQQSLLIHLGMSGRLLYHNTFEGYKKHDHFALLFEETKPDLRKASPAKERLIFNDPRRFGSVTLIKTDQLETLKALSSLGPEPLLAKFNSRYFFDAITNRKTSIKNLIMNNQIVVGIGNIYANESLFDARIAPTRLGSSLSYDEAARLVNSAKKILAIAIKHRGSSIRDYLTATGDFGGFQKLFKVYGQENKKCLVCKSIIKRIVQSQRSSFYCPTCQK